MSYNNGPTIVRDGLVLYYDPASPKSYVSGSTTIYDLSPTGTTASLVNGVGYASSSQGVFNFDGVNDYISFARPSSIVTSGSLSICMYAKWDLATGSTAIQVLMDNSHSAAPVQGFVLQDRPDVNKRLSFSVRPTASFGATSSFRVSTDNWYNLTATHDGTVSRLYINGILDGFLTESNGISTVQPTINIGRWQNAATGSRFLTGSIGQVLLYNRALSATEVKQNYDATKGRYPGVNPYVLREDFEGTSFPNWTLTSFAVDSVDPLFGAKSLRLLGTNNAAVVNFAPQDEVWMFLSYKLTGDPFVTFVQLRNSSDVSLCAIGPWGASNTRVIGGGIDVFPTTLLPRSQTAYIWIRYVRGTGSNSISEFYVSTTPVRPVTPFYSWTNANNTTPASRIWLGAGAASADLKYDYLRISKNPIGSYPL